MNNSYFLIKKLALLIIGVSLCELGATMQLQLTEPEQTDLRLLKEANTEIFGSDAIHKIPFHKAPLEASLNLYRRDVRQKLNYVYLIPTLRALYSGGIFSQFGISDFKFFNKILPQRFSLDGITIDGKEKLLQYYIGAHRADLVRKLIRSGDGCSGNLGEYEDAKALFSDSEINYGQLSDSTKLDSVLDANVEKFGEFNRLRAPIVLYRGVFSELVSSLSKEGIFRLYNNEERNLVLHLSFKKWLYLFGEPSYEDKSSFAKCLVAAIRSHFLANCNYNKAEMREYLDKKKGFLLKAFEDAEKESRLFWKVEPRKIIYLASKWFPFGESKYDKDHYLIMHLLKPILEPGKKLSPMEELRWMECLVECWRAKVVEYAKARAKDSSLAETHRKSD